MVLYNEQILWRILWQILAASPEVLGNISGSWGFVLAGLEIWLALQEEDTILLVYELLEARLYAVRFIFLVCNKLIWRNLIEGCKIRVLRPIRTKVALI